MSLKKILLAFEKNEETKDRDQENDNEKNTTTVVTDEKVVVLSVEEQSVSMFLTMMMSGLLIWQLPTMLSVQKSCLPCTKQETLVHRR